MVRAEVCEMGFLRVLNQHIHNKKTIEDSSGQTVQQLKFNANVSFTNYEYDVIVHQLAAIFNQMETMEWASSVMECTHQQTQQMLIVLSDLGKKLMDSFTLTDNVMSDFLWVTTADTETAIKECHGPAGDYVDFVLEHLYRQFCGRTHNVKDHLAQWHVAQAELRCCDPQARGHLSRAESLIPGSLHRLKATQLNQLMI